MAKMQEVYNFSVDPADVPGGFVELTVDHLFGDVWMRPELDIRQRRLITIGVLAALGRGELLEVAVRQRLPQRRAVRGPGARHGGASRPLRRLAARDRGQRCGGTLYQPPPQEMSAMTTFDFAGKVAIVTGAGRGIGQAYAEALARAGASVVVADLDEDNAVAVAAGIETAGGHGRAVSEWTSPIPMAAAAMAKHAIDRFGGIDYLVNNAAIFGGMKLDFLLTVDWEYLQRFLSREPDGRAGVHPGVLQGDGRARRRCHREPVVHGRVALRRLLRLGQGGHQLPHPAARPRARVHEHPRSTPSPRGRPTPTRPARSSRRSSCATSIGSLALKRQGEPDDLVGMCLFLLSDDARWITGHIFNVDGGQVMRP